MGTRYFLEINCPHCDKTNYDVYYALTCDLTTWRCEHCDKTFDIEQFFKDENASNAEEIEKAITSHTEQPLFNKILNEMTKTELQSLVQHYSIQLRYCKLAHKSTKHQLEAANLLKGILRRKLKVAQEAITLVKRLCDERRDCEGIEKRVKQLRSAGEYVLTKWRAIQ